jgi:hypothetical protein
VTLQVKSRDALAAQGLPLSLQQPISALTDAGVLYAIVIVATLFFALGAEFPY